MPNVEGKTFFVEREQNVCKVIFPLESLSLKCSDTSDSTTVFEYAPPIFNSRIILSIFDGCDGNELVSLS